MQGALVHRTVRAHAGSACELAWSVPLDMALAGKPLYVQGLCRGEPGTGGPGLIRFAAGQLSNALDLVLGF